MRRLRAMWLAWRRRRARDDRFAREWEADRAAWEQRMNREVAPLWWADKAKEVFGVAKPKVEPEVADTADLKRFGCPYKAGDPRTLVWLAGYRDGIKEGGRLARETINEVLK